MLGDKEEDEWLGWMDEKWELWQGSIDIFAVELEEVCCKLSSHSSKGKKNS